MLGSYLTDVGFTPQEMRHIQDARYLRVIDDAVKYRQHMKQQQTDGNGATPAAGVPVRKMLKRVPRTLRPSTPTDADAVQTDRRNTTFKRFQKSGSERDAANFLSQEGGYIDQIMGE